MYGFLNKFSQSVTYKKYMKNRMENMNDDRMIPLCLLAVLVKIEHYVHILRGRPINYARVLFGICNITWVSLCCEIVLKFDYIGLAK